MRRCRSQPLRRRTLLALAVALCLLLCPSDTVGAQDPVIPEPVLYAAPMLTDVIDPFRPPAQFAGPGNRGLEYGASDNQVVAAAASGYVVFAGPVAGRKAITIQHADGVRTTYTGLLEIWVVSGMTVNQHSAIAVASTGFHFGARIRDHYLDPQILLDSSQEELRPQLLPPQD